MANLILDRGPVIRRALLLAIVVGVPLVFFIGTNDRFNTPKLTLLMAGVLLVLGIRLAEILQGASWRGLTRLAVPAVALAVPLVVSWLLSPYRGWSLFGLVGRYQGLIPYLAVIALGVLLADAFAERLDDVALALLWSGGIAGGYALLQAIGADPFNWSLGGGQTTGISTLGNPNFTGGFLGMVIPVGIALVLARPDRRVVALRLLGIVVAGWLLTRSQGGWAAGLAGASVVGGVALSGHRRITRLAGLLLAAVIALGIVGSVVYSTVSPEARFASSTFETRGRWWQAAAAMGLDAPVLGRGPNSFTVDGVSHRPLDDALAFNYDFPDDPHSVPLSFFANTGLLGVAGFAVVVGWAVAQGMSLGRERLLGIGFFGAVVAYVIQSLVSIDEIALRATLWAALGALAAARWTPEAQRNATKKKRAARRKPVSARAPVRNLPAVVVVTLVTLMGLIWTVLFFVTDVRVLHAARLIGLQRSDDARVEFERVHSFREDAAYQAIEALNAKREALQQGPEGEEFFDMSRAAFGGYVDDVPFLHGVAEFGRLLDEWSEEQGRDDDEEAAALWSRAMAIDPLNPLIRAELGHVLLELDRPADASEVLEPAAATAGPVYGEFWGVLALARYELGEERAAQEALEIAIASAATHPVVVEAQEVIEGEPQE